MAEEKKSTYVSLRVKMIGALTLLFGLMFVLAFFGFTRLARTLALERVEEDLVGTLEGAAKGVNTEDLVSLTEDARELARELATSDEGFAIPDFSGSTIAVVAAESANGVWQYSADGGESWQDFPSLSDASALQLGSNEETRVRLVSTQYEGDASITYWKIDAEYAESGVMVDASPPEDSEEEATTRFLARMGYSVAADKLGEDARYERLMDWLDEVNQLEWRAWPYVYVPEDQTNSYVAIADLWNRYDEDKAFPYLYYSISSKGILTQGFGKLTLHPENLTGGYDDQYGNWVTAYTPILDADGKSVGALGVDFRGEYVSEVTSRVQNQVLLFFVIGYVIFLLFIFVLSILFTRPITTLASAAEKIGEGDYEQDIQEMSIGPFRDELTILADVFEIMISKVYQREQTLRRRVEELQIMVDEQKKVEQVSEIVESEFFQDLRAKAKAMRERSEKGEASEEPDDKAAARKSKS